MGVGTWGDMVDLGQLRSSVGSKDQTLLAAIQERNAVYLVEDEDRINLHETGGFSVRGALSHLLSGHPPEHCGASYLLAFDLLGAFLGERLEDVEDCLGDLEDLELDTGLTGSGPPVPLPGLEDRGGFLISDQVRSELEAIETQAAHEDENIEAAREVLRSFLAQARSKGTDLVTITS